MNNGQWHEIFGNYCTAAEIIAEAGDDLESGLARIYAELYEKSDDEYEPLDWDTCRRLARDLEREEAE